METQGLNLFIVDDNKSMVYALKQYLKSRFGGKLKISTFYDGESCLEKINEETDVVILDYFLNGRNGNEILRSIKERNPRTEVIMLSGNENIQTALESYKLGAKNYVVKGQSAWNKITILVENIISHPIRLFKELGVSDFLSIFLLTFMAMIVVVYLILKLIH